MVPFAKSPTRLGKPYCADAGQQQRIRSSPFQRANCAGRLCKSPPITFHKRIICVRSGSRCWAENQGSHEKNPETHAIGPRLCVQAFKITEARQAHRKQLDEMIVTYRRFFSWVRNEVGGRLLCFRALREQGRWRPRPTQPLYFLKVAAPEEKGRRVLGPLNLHFPGRNAEAAGFQVGDIHRKIGDQPSLNSHNVLVVV